MNPLKKARIDKKVKDRKKRNLRRRVLRIAKCCKTFKQSLRLWNWIDYQDDSDNMFIMFDAGMSLNPRSEEIEKAIYNDIDNQLKRMVQS